MSLARRAGEYRPLILLIVLVSLSVLSLAGGTRATTVTRPVGLAVSVTTYPFLVALTQVRGGTQYVRDFMLDYHAARLEATALRAEVATLSQRTATLQQQAEQNARLKEMLRFTQNEALVTLKGAEIIARDRGILTIAAGSRAGIEMDMPVISPAGFVGVITQVEPFSSDVATVLSPDCRVGVTIERNRAHGIVTGTRSDISQFSQLLYVYDVLEGDRLVTSRGSRYPGGYPVGEVMQVRDGGTLLNTAVVRPAAEPSRLDEVFVVMSAAPPAETLTESTPALSLAGNSPAQPDTRTLQERYAP